MTDSGTGFAVDLYLLEKVAKDHLATVAIVYGNAIGKAQSAKAGLDSLPSVPEQFQGAGESVSHGYDQLHGAISDVLQSTRTSLEETAEALHQAAMLYAEQDQGTANKLQQLIEDRGGLNPELTP